MEYSFNIYFAEEYGVNEAIMIKNLSYWITVNKANNKNYYDGHYWTYNSRKALAEIFSFWTETQIKTILKNLIAKGVLIKGNYNKMKYDQTSWYAFVDEEKFLKKPKNDNKSLGQIYPMERTEVSNELDRNNQPIPDNNTYIKPDNISAIKNKHGDHQNVMLSDKEYQQLIKDHGNELITKTINDLSWYIATRNCKYKNHNLTIRNWIRLNSQRSIPPARRKTTGAATADMY
jgi:hypothetical protein